MKKVLILLVVLMCSAGCEALFGPDNSDFGRRHPIPDGMDVNIPLPVEWSVKDGEIEASYTEAGVYENVTDTYLQVWEGFQGGIYQYDFYYGPLPAGEIFLRCYEVTENIPLSESRLTQASTVEISATTTFSCLVNKQEFVIYEGVWGEYYAARIEVWFKNAETLQERKLLEKVYRVEGWQR